MAALRAPLILVTTAALLVAGADSARAQDPHRVGTSHVSADRPDVLGADGVVYRFLPGVGYQFHPLANFARLNVLVTQWRVGETRRLARALVVRGIARRGALYWEYSFSFGGPSRWTSGFAQAVAAQSLARAGDILGDPALSRAAYRAFRAIPQSLLRPLGGGSWIVEYSFNDMAVLNAQLQSLLSLDSYGELTEAPDVHRTIARLDVAARTLLPRFDTGCWSRYSLGGNDADLHYHSYHVELLGRLATTRPHAIWRRTHDRWSRLLEHRALPCHQR
jgi:D-glucuronyl C5-epimerase-like protein